MRIGGEMELTPESFGAPVPQDAWPRPGADHFLWTDSGRSALFLAARDHLGRDGKARVHLPGFSCHSVMEPFMATGFEITYYDITPDGAVCDPPGLAQGELVLVVHYFGFENANRRHLAALADTSGAKLIDDYVQASLNVGWTLEADYAVTSLRKFLSVPDGACLLSRHPVSAGLAPSDEQFISERLAAKLLRAHSVDSGLFLGLAERSESRLAPGSPRLPSVASALLLANQPTAAVISRRRENWLSLLDGLTSNGLATRAVPVFRSLQDNEVPLGFPVVFPAGQRDTIRAALRSAGIYCPVHWDLPHVPEDTAPAARDLSGRIMTIPVDQRYSGADMDAIIRQLTHVLPVRHTISSRSEIVSASDNAAKTKI